MARPHKPRPSGRTDRTCNTSGPPAAAGQCRENVQRRDQSGDNGSPDARGTGQARRRQACVPRIRQGPRRLQRGHPARPQFCTAPTLPGPRRGPKNIIGTARSPTITAAIDRDPTNASYRVARAESWSAQGMHKRAMADFEDALRMEPNNPSFWVSRGNEWRRDLKLDDAIGDYTRALQIDPRYAAAYIARGNTWKQRRVFDRAIQEFSELIQIDPENALAHMTLARILATCSRDQFPQRQVGRRRGDAILRAHELARSRLPRHARRRLCRGRDYATAIKWQTQAIKLVRQNVQSLLQQKAVNFGGRAGESASRIAWSFTRARNQPANDRADLSARCILQETIDHHLEPPLELQAHRLALGEDLGVGPLLRAGLLQQQERDRARSPAAMNEHLAPFPAECLSMKLQTAVTPCTVKGADPTP